MGRGDLERRGINEGKRVEEMGESSCVELLRGLGVAFAGADIPRLVVANSSSVSAAAALSARRRGSNIAGSVASLTGKGLVDGVGVITEDFGCLKG